MDDNWSSNYKSVRSKSTSLPEFIRIKVLSLGSVGVGKSCLIKRYCEERFVSKYASTIGVDYGVKQVTVQNKEIKVNFWDLSGHNEFVEIRNEFYKDTQGVLLVYDVNIKKSFEQLEDWMKEAQRFGIGHPIVMVCANKIDIKRRGVSEREGKEWAQANGYLYTETSAMSGIGVKEAFERMLQTVVELKQLL